MKRKCVFFDRDGIVNKSPGPGYVESWQDFQLMPGLPGVLRTVRRLGYDGVIVTNQRGVALGVMTQSAVDEIHDRLRRLLAEEQHVEILDILYCPHDNGECQCRKPLPGMLLEAARRHGIDLTSSWMVGDSERDIEAGRAAGCRTILVGSSGQPTNADFRAAGMDELKTMLAELLGRE